MSALTIIFDMRNEVNIGHVWNLTFSYFEYKRKRNLDLKLSQDLHKSPFIEQV